MEKAGRAGARRTKRVEVRRNWSVAAGVFDRYIRDAGHYANTVDYIHENPVKAGLVKNAREWKYSSVGGFSVLDD